MKKIADATSWDRTVFALSTYTERSYYNRMNLIDELRGQMSREELEGSGDTLAMLAVYHFQRHDKELDAYWEVTKALRQDPSNLTLQRVLDGCLAPLLKKYRKLINNDIRNPGIESYFNVLGDEGQLEASDFLLYVLHLIELERFPEAARRLKTLIKLFPALLGLRDVTERVALKVPDPDFFEYLNRPTVLVGRPTIRNQHEPSFIMKLSSRYDELYEAVSSSSPNPAIEKELREILGNVTEESPIDLRLKDIYYLKAKFDFNSGRIWDAIVLLRSLLEIDPFNKAIRNTLDFACFDFSFQVACEHAEGKLKINLENVYNVLREISVVHRALIREKARSELDAGNESVAKELIETLMELDPLNPEYIVDNFLIAFESENLKWITEAKKKILEALALRPWDMKLKSLADGFMVNRF